jgi:hypothetical protein
VAFFLRKCLAKVMERNGFIMGYGDPRRAARYANRQAWRANRRQFRGPRRSGFGAIFVLFLIIAIFSHHIELIFYGVVLVFVLMVVFRIIGNSIFNSWFGGPQQFQGPQQPYEQAQPPLYQNPYQNPYQPSPAQQEPYQSYEQGYQPPPQSQEPYYHAGGQEQPYPPQPAESTAQHYEEPQAQYPEQLPPMQQ